MSQRYLYDFQADHDLDADAVDALAAKIGEHPQVLAVAVDKVQPHQIAIEIIISYDDPASPYDVVEPVQAVLDAAGLQTFGRGGGQVDDHINSFADLAHMVIS